jgi:hypothetical protein
MEQLSVTGNCVPEAVLQDAFAQVIGELGPTLRKQLGYVEDARTAAEEAANERVDAAVLFSASVQRSLPRPAIILLAIRALIIMITTTTTNSWTAIDRYRFMAECADALITALDAT